MVTSLCNGCFEEPLAPTVVHLAVTSSEGDLDRLEVANTHNRRVPSSVDQRKGLVEVGQGKVDEHTCSAVLDVFDEDGCEIVAVIRSWSSGVGHQTSVQKGSSKGVRVRGWVRLVSEGTGTEQHGCSWRKHYWGEGLPAGSYRNRVCDVCWPYQNPRVLHPHLFDHLNRWRDRR